MSILNTKSNKNISHWVTAPFSLPLPSTPLVAAQNQSMEDKLREVLVAAQNQSMEDKLRGLYAGAVTAKEIGENFVANLRIEKIENGFLLYVATKEGAKYAKFFISSFNEIEGFLVSHIAAEKILGESDK